MKQMAAYQSVRQLVLRRIQEKAYCPGAQIDSFRNLARDTGTSTLSVFRALTLMVSEGYLRNDPRRGYFVMEPAAREPVRREGTIGFLMCKPTASTEMPMDFQNLLTTSQTLVMEMNRSILILGALVSGAAPKVYMVPESVAENRLSGVLTIGIYDLPYLARLAAVQPCVVALDVDTSDVAVSCISFDNFCSGSALVQRLHGRGARRIAFIGGPFPPPTPDIQGVIYDPCAKERFYGWRVGMQNAGLSAEPELSPMVSFRDGRGEREIGRFVRTLFEQKRPPDAIVTEFPEAVCAALEGAGIRPGHIPVAGWVSKGQEKDLPPGVTFAALCDFKELAKQGIEVLSCRMEGPRPKADCRLAALAILDLTAVAVGG